MLLTRNQILSLGYLIKEIKTNNLECSITTKYKLLKLESSLKEEFELTHQLLSELSLKYAEKDDKNNIITLNGGIKIQKGRVEQMKSELEEFEKGTVILPEIYFTIEELDGLNLSWAAMENLMPFIKS